MPVDSVGRSDSPLKAGTRVRIPLGAPCFPGFRESRPQPYENHTKTSACILTITRGVQTMTNKSFRVAEALGEADALKELIARLLEADADQRERDAELSADTLRRCSDVIERMGTLLMPNWHSADVQKITRDDFPEVLERVLDDANRRVWQAQAILQLTIGLIDGSPEPDSTEVERIMLALENTVQTLEPIPQWISCNQGLAIACNAYISKDMKEAAVAKAEDESDIAR